MFRPMRRMGQQLTDERCREILTEAKRGVLSLQGDDGYPYGVPMDYYFAGGSLYYHCAKEGHKIDAIRRSEKASFCVLSEGVKEEASWWYHFDSVIVFGRITLVEDPEEKENALRLLGNKYMPDPAGTEKEIAMHGAQAQILRLDIEHVSGKHVREK